LFYYLAYICKSIGINYYFFRFLLSLFCLTSITWAFQDITKTNQKLKSNKFQFVISFLIIMFAIQYIQISWGIRYGFMSICILMSIYLLDRKNILTSIFFILLGISMHFSAFMFIPAIFLGYILKNKSFTFLEKIILSIICILSGKFLFDYVYTYLPDIFHSDTYLTGSWSDNKNKSFNGQMYLLIRTRLVSIIIIYIFFIFKSKYRSVISNITLFLIFTFFIVWSYDALIDRVWTTISPILAFSIILLSFNYNFKFSKNKLIIILMLFFLLQCMTIYSEKENVFSKETLKGFLSPISLVYNENYDDAYFFRKGLFYF